MKQAAVQNSAARSAAVNSPLNDSGRADALLIIAGRRETWIKRSRHHYGLLNRLLRFLMEPQKKVLSVRRLCQAKRTQLFDPVHGRTILRQTD